MRPDEERLADILDVAERVAVRVRRGREHFDADEDTQLAVVRLLEILGEAASRLSPDFRAAHPELPWRAVTGLRNRVVHAHFDVDLEIVWQAAEHGVPRFAEQVRSILRPS